MKYDQLMRQCGIIRRADFTSPKYASLTGFKLSETSILHFIPESEAIIGPRPDDPLLLHTLSGNTIPMVDHLEHYSDPYGDPKKITNTTNRMITNYHRSYRLMRKLRRKEVVLRNKQILLIINYGIIPHQYKFTRSVYSDYWKTLSILNTWVNKSNDYAQVSDRQQFILVPLPETMKSLDEYKKLFNIIPRKSLFELNAGDTWLINLLKWITNVEDKSTIFYTLSKKALERVNLCWMVDTSITIAPMNKLMDLATVNSGQKDRIFYGYIESIISNRKPELIETEDNTIPLGEGEAKELDSEIKLLAEDMAESGKISAAEYKRLIKLSSRYEDIDNPFGEGNIKDLAEKAVSIANKVSNEKMIELDTILDKSMEFSVLKNYDGDYIKNVMQSDIAGAVLSIQNAGIAVTNYKVEKVTDAANSYYSYSIQLTPTLGKPSTVNFQLPVAKEDGTFIANGVKNRLDKQRADMPIRKINSTRVALTSYYGKVFIDRDERTPYNYGRWLGNRLITLTESSENDIKITLGDVFNPDVKTPIVYSAMAKRITSLKYKSYYLFFDYNARANNINESKLSSYESGGMIVCGTKGKSIITIDINNTFYLNDENKSTVIGDINALLEGKLGIGPINIATVKIFGTNIALGVILSYRYGLTKLLKRLKAKYRIVRKGTRTELTDTEYTVSFKDETLILDKEEIDNSLILAGFNQFKTIIKDYPIGEFDSPNIYLNVLEGRGMGIRHLKEVDLMYQMFIDPITLEILKEIKEPTTVTGLFLRSVELLATDDHPRETDMAYMRIRGYERMPGLVYTEIVKALRSYNGKPKNASSQVEMNPRAIWMATVTDPSLMLVEDLNPINNLKEKERVSYSGLGGRDAQTMVRRTREFHPNDRGIISEATLDSGKAGATTYLTSDPNFVNMRGVTRRASKDDGYAKQVSTTAALLPCADREDPKRTNFINVQYTHTIAIEGNDIQPLRTGYEEVIAHRADPLYAITAEEDGTITKLTKNSLELSYKSGAKTTHRIGTIFGKVSSIHIPHKIICDRTVGYRFKAGEVIAFNIGYFKRDYFNPTQVAFMSGYMASVALMESTDTLEDSCAISQLASEKMKTKISINRDIIIGYDQAIHNLVNIGDKVDLDSPLCYIEDAVTSESGLFDEEVISTLGTLSANVPKAKEVGVIDDIDIIYYGDKDDMSPNMKRLANKFDKIRTAKVKEQNSDQATTGELFDAILVGKTRLTRNNMVIRFKITKEVGTGVGDKGVVANQLKTVIGRTMRGVNKTESGEPIDVIFGFQSISNRIVLSPEITGTINKTLRLISIKAGELYDS